MRQEYHCRANFAPISRADLLKGLENVKTIIKTLPLQQLKATFPNIIIFDDYDDIGTNRINVFKYKDSAVLDDMDKIQITLCENRYDVSEFTKRIGEKYNVGIEWSKATLSLAVRGANEDFTHADENAAKVMRIALPRLDQALGMFTPAELRDLQTSGKTLFISHTASSDLTAANQIAVNIFTGDKPVEQMKADIISQIGNNKEFNLQNK